MDKGLIRIQELEQNLKQLEIKKEKNDKDRFELIAEDTRLDTRIYNMDQEIQKLNRDKSQSEVAPTKRKEDKKNLIISFILSYIITSLIVLFVVYIGSGGAASILKCLASTSLVMAFVSSIAIPLEFKSINKKYPIGNLAQLEKDISVNNTQLDFLKSKKKEISDKIVNLGEIKINLEKEIQTLLEQITSITFLRTKIIDEYCKDNPILDKKLDDAYDKSKVKEKVK